MNKISVNSQIEEMRNNANKMHEEQIKQHEFDSALSFVVTAMHKSQIEDERKTEKQLSNNEIITSIIDNQFSFYDESYDRLLNTVPNGYRG